MINPNVIDLEVVDAIIKAHPYIDAVDKQLVANKNLVKGAFPDITEVDAHHCLASDQIDIYIDFTRNGHKLCAMWHYRHAADDGKMEAATGLSVYELYRTDEWEPIYTAHDTPEELLDLIRKYSDKPKDGHGITATEQAAPTPDDIEYNGQGGGVDTTELLAATEALDDDLLVLHMGQGKANLKKEEA